MFALGFWPWSLLAQPNPLPERLIGSADAVIANALSHEWGTSPGAFLQRVRSAYLARSTTPDHVHAICEDYRAAPTIDRDHDAGGPGAS